MDHASLLLDVERTPRAFALRVLTAIMLSIGKENTTKSTAEAPNAHLQPLPSRNAVAIGGPMNVVRRVGRS